MKIVYDENLYLAPPAVYVDVLNSLPEDCQSVLLIGHNPGLEELVSQLTSQPVTMPTAALAHLQWETDSWQQLTGTESATLRDLWIPRELD